jgi:predicted ester cyclase
MTRDETQAFFLERQRAWSNHDVEALTNGHAENGTVTSPLFGSIRGREQIGESYRTLFRGFSEQHYVFEPTLIDGDRVAQPFTVSLVHTGEFMGMAGTGRHAQIQFVFFSDMANGLIAHEQRLYDFTSLLIQIGALRAKPAK